MEIGKVIRRFDDVNGHGGLYEVDDFYLHQNRIPVLSTKKNKYNKPFIKKLTVTEIEEELKLREVKYEAKLNKDELVELLITELEK